jgi:hypothetical protein
VTAIETSGREITPELADLMEWEKPIEQGAQAMLDMATSFKVIRDDRKYRASGFSTFDDYCRQRWGLSRRRVDQMIAAGELAAGLRTLVLDSTPLPTTERQVRPLAAVADPVDRAAIWEQAVENSGGEQPTAAEVAAVVAEHTAAPEWKVEPKQPDPTANEQFAIVDPEPAQPQRLGHPATYSRAVLNVIASYLKPGDEVLDPFAGVGTIHELRERCGVETYAIELEPEWAALHDATICGDALDLDEMIYADSIDVIATSPAYGNRMADHHEARDGSHRNTYKHMLGRDLTDGSSAAMQWGPEYRKFHALVWAQCVDALRPEVGLFILNIKDHVRGGEVQHVASWHVDQLCRVLGLRLIAHHIIPGAGLPSGENDDLRVVGEEIYVFSNRQEVAA